MLQLIIGIVIIGLAAVFAWFGGQMAKDGWEQIKKSKPASTTKTEVTPEKVYKQDKQGKVSPVVVGTDTSNMIQHKHETDNTRLNTDKIINSLLRNIEHAYKKKDTQEISKTFTDRSCSSNIEDYWNRPKAPSEIKLDIISDTSLGIPGTGIVIDLNVQGKEFGEWRSYGIIKTKLILDGETVKLEKCQFLD